MAREKITVRSGVMIGGKFTEIKDLSRQEREEWQQRQMERVSRVFSDHFTAHPDELADFVQSPTVTVLG